jgi:hypothetical protein
VFSDSILSDAITNIIQKGRRGHTLQVYIREKDLWLRSRLTNLSPADLKIFINNLEVMAGIMENK